MIKNIYHDTAVWIFARAQQLEDCAPHLSWQNGPFAFELVGRSRDHVG